MATGANRHRWRATIPSRFLAALTGGLALVLALTVMPPAPTADAATGCSVKNTATGRTYSTLQAAVNAAKPRAALLVRGTCRGATIIRKPLTLQGRQTKRWGAPALDGAGKVRPLTLRFGRPGPVTIRNLVIRNGRATGDQSWPGSGGGIKTFRSLRLHDVVIRDNRAEYYGGGIWGDGASIKLRGTSRITSNHAGGASGGIGCAYCSVVLADRSRIVGNNTGGSGGGIGVWWTGTVRLFDRSIVSRNTARGQGGGMIIASADVRLVDASSIRRNRALAGGGIYDIGGDEDASGSRIALAGSSSVSGNRAVAPDGSCEADAHGEPGSAGGVWLADDSTLTMAGSSVINGNDAACEAGGIMSLGELRGVICAPAPGSNVHVNRPNDCVEPSRGAE